MLYNESLVLYRVWTDQGRARRNKKTKKTVRCRRKKTFYSTSDSCGQRTQWQPFWFCWECIFGRAAVASTHNWTFLTELDYLKGQTLFSSLGSFYLPFLFRAIFVFSKPDVSELCQALIRTASAVKLVSHFEFVLFSPAMPSSDKLLFKSF